MNILLISGLSGENADSIVKPILGIKGINKIFWIRHDSYRPSKKIIPITINRKFINNENQSYNVLYKLFKTEKNILFRPGSFRKLLSKLYYGMLTVKKKKPDYIISALLYPHGIIAYFLSKFSGIPWIHIIIAGERETHLFGSFFGTIMCKMLLSAKCVTITGRQTRNFLKENNLENTEILPNTISMSRFKTSKKRKEYDLLVVTRLWRIKRIDRLIEIVYILRQIKNSITVGIIGDGPEESYLKNLVTDKDLEKNIHFFGRLNHDSIPDFMVKGKIFVLTSSGEGVPLTLLESMASGMVCITPRVGDVEDVIENGINGFLIDDPNNLQNYADIIIEVLNDRNIYTSVSQAALKVKNIYDYSNATEIWKKILIKS